LFQALVEGIWVTHAGMCTKISCEEANLKEQNTTPKNICLIVKLQLYDENIIFQHNYLCNTARNSDKTERLDHFVDRR